MEDGATCRETRLAWRQRAAAGARLPRAAFAAVLRSWSLVAWSRYNYTHFLYCKVINMKAIQITLDDALLARLDADEEVQRDGRSAVLRRAADQYLRSRRKRAVAEQYAKAYGAGAGLGPEFSGWDDEGAWPEK